MHRQSDFYSRNTYYCEIDSKTQMLSRQETVILVIELVLQTSNIAIQLYIAKPNRRLGLVFTSPSPGPSLER